MAQFLEGKIETDEQKALQEENERLSPAIGYVRANIADIDEQYCFTGIERISMDNKCDRQIFDNWINVFLAVGVVGLFCNEKAYSEAFHVTGDERLTWKGVLDAVIEANEKSANVIDMPTEEIVSILPEFIRNTLWR